MAKKTTNEVNKDLSQTLNELEVVKKNARPKRMPAKKIQDPRESIEVKFKLLNEDAKLPQYAHQGDIGMDVVATGVEYNYECDYFIYHTGLSCETKEGVALLLMMRSSVSETNGSLCNAVGLVDPYTYRGEICFRFRPLCPTAMWISSVANVAWNNMKWYKRLFIKYSDFVEQTADKIFDNIIKYAPCQVGERIGQMVFVNTPSVNTIQVDELSETERADGGFGSSGKK